MRNHRINNLKDLIKVYGNQKTDQEIAEMLAIPLDQVENERKKIAPNRAK